MIHRVTVRHIICVCIFRGKKIPNSFRFPKNSPHSFTLLHLYDFPAQQLDVGADGDVRTSKETLKEAL